MGSIHSGTVTSTEPQAEDDSVLRGLLEKYVAEEKNRKFSPAKVSAFVREQRKQLALPPKKRDWARARQLYLAMFDIDEAKLETIEGARFSGGWTGSGSLYALTAQPMSLASSLPTMYMASVPQDELNRRLVYYARIVLVAQVLIVIATPLVTMALQQFWSAPADRFSKWDRTLQLNLESTRLVKPSGKPGAAAETQAEQAEEAGVWTSDQLDLADLRAQWKGPIGVHLALHQECLETELRVCQQRMAEHRQRTAKKDQQQGRPRKPAATAARKGRWLALEVRISELEADLAHLRADRWMDMSAHGRARLLDAIQGQKPWTLSLRTAWARLRQPPELIAQVAQRIGSQFAMFVAGSNMQLIVSNVIRFANAQRTEQGLPPAVSRNELYAINVCIALLSVAMAFASGAAISFKIRQRADLRKKIDRAGFRWEQVPRALWAILKAMFAVPRAIVDRARVERAAARASTLAGELALRIATLKGAVEEWQGEADGAAKPVQT
ncbi:uncharacterized protein THITE_2130943 [Thermothielavioides terrestris NRRL 8126]|uniref:Uncharacterized protein n=1 Tax=Thermothielavioides terrestris (strain ATCC 38088 / NRRL 8126) TaxID=578455 RepID=G2RBZ8_THETT|nr:uncharacterized protein THITE_2130943 [Thermothielavioides terrestris NRRL 8126]AEO69319.1 hypothetical protein THITE_2130943 [Thermothielavioides terrestris NRRL 8126]